MTLSASDVSDAVLDGLKDLTGHVGEREALAALRRWHLPLTDSQERRLLAFATTIIETEVARLDDELANQQYEEDLQAERYAHQHELDRDIGSPIPLDDDAEISEWRHQEDPF